MTDKTQALHRCFLFSSLDKARLAEVARIVSLGTWKKGESLFQEGDEATGFYIVLKGKVKITKLSPDGREHILHVISEGASLAEAVVFGDMNRYPAFADAMTDTVQTLFIPKRDFLALIRSDFSLTLAVLRSMGEKLRTFNALVEELSLKSADARVAKYLLDLGQRNKSDRFTLDIKKVELARRLGIVPETLSRIFRRLGKQRVLSVDRHDVHILRREKLQALSSGEPL